MARRSSGVIRQLHQAKHERLPELADLLRDTFLEEGGVWRAPDPAKASDLERLRAQALIREFQSHLASRGKLKQFRTEAIRASFADAYARADYATIVSVAERLPEEVLQEDAALLMYYDNAALRG